MATEIVTAVYKPKAGQSEALHALIASHVPALRAEGLATDRQTIVMRSPKDGTYIEIFEWATSDAAEQAHTNPAVQAIWGPMMEVATFNPLAELPESTTPFPHFEPVLDLCQ